MNKKIIQVRDKYKFIESILKYQSNGLYISFEGKLLDYGFDKIGCIINEENTILKRNVVEPKPDFFVLNLSRVNIDEMLSILKIEDVLEWDVFHIKIANTHEIVFESYDWFSDCYLNSDFYNLAFINNLVDKDIIELVS